MIGSGSYTDARLDAINLLSSCDCQIIELKLIKKDGMWWVEYEEMDINEEE